MSLTHCVSDLMNPDIMTVTEDMTTDELARYLTEREISGAPVVDSQGHLVGIVSMTDVARHLAEPDDYGSPGPSPLDRDIADEASIEDLGPRYVEGRTAIVRDVMTPAIHQVPVAASTADAARLMLEHHIHRLVVTDGKQPVGIITSMDLLRVIANTA